MNVKINRNINLARKNPYRGLKNLQNSLDNFFSETRWPIRDEEWKEEFPLTSQLNEDKDNYYFQVDLPGTKKEKVKIEVENNILRIQGERKEEKKLEDTKRHYSEIVYGIFSQDYSLPKDIVSTNIKANYENGVLTVIVPKSSESKTQEIKIE